MTLHISLDGETLPTTDEKVIAKLVAEIEAPANYKDPDKIASYRAEKAKTVVEKRALSANYGSLACIAYALGDDEPRGRSSYCGERDGNPLFSEASMLSSFFEDLDEPIQRSRGNFKFIGHNIANFDVRFITQRAMILGVKIPRWWPWNAKPWDAVIFDTQVVWAGANGYICLDALCDILGLPGKGDVDGSMVAGLWAAGKFDIVHTYCCDDVRTVRAVAKKMMRALPEAA